MERTLIKDISGRIGESATIAGRIIALRGLGNIKFIVIQDYTGKIQSVWDDAHPVDAKIGDAVSLVGKVVEEKRAKGGCEITGESLTVVSSNIEDYPFDLGNPNMNLQLATLLDNRTLTVRHPKVRAILKLYDLVLEGYAKAMRAEGFTEVKTPKLLGAATEGGANFFEVQYFEQKAFLAQSPQFYKQIMVGALERVFEIGTAFRAEPHFTTRHVNEYISFDAEMGFIESFRDVMRMLNRVMKTVFAHIGEYGAEHLAMYDAKMPVVPDEIPAIKLADLRKLVKERYDYEIPAETDIDPEGERLAGRYAKEEFDSDFIFITHYPWKDKPFYTMPSSDNPEETEGFDLIFRGVELATGSQRIHNYDMLMENMKKKGVSPVGMEWYVNTFKYSMPPHGGWGLGSERLLQQLLGLSSIKEVIAFPRDVKRLEP